MKDSKSDLMDVQFLMQLVSSLQLPKQMMIDAREDERNRCFSSEPPGSAWIFNCHVRTQNAIAMILQVFSKILFNRCLIVPTNDDQCKNQHEEWWILMKKWKKVWREIERIERIWRLNLRKWIMDPKIQLWLGIYTSC